MGLGWGGVDENHTGSRDGEGSWLWTVISDDKNCEEKTVMSGESLRSLYLIPKPGVTIKYS